MEKRCKECKFKFYEEFNNNHPFCTCLEEEPRQYAQEWLNHINRYSIKFGLAKERSVMPENYYPSCQLVQSAYAELCGKRCPFNTTEAQDE